MEDRIICKILNKDGTIKRVGVEGEGSYTIKEIIDNIIKKARKYYTVDKEGNKVPVKIKEIGNTEFIKTSDDKTIKNNLYELTNCQTN